MAGAERILNEPDASGSRVHETFILVGSDKPHPARRRAILAAHPEVKKLINHDPLTAIITLAVVSLQTFTAAFFGNIGISHWWMAVLGAYLIGAFANHTLLIIIHDACHNTIFKSPVWNKLTGIFADLPNTFPTAMAFRCYHRQHHSHLGELDFDADLPSRWETQIFGGRWYGKAAWLFLFPALQLSRLSRMKGTGPMRNVWTYVNTACVLTYDLMIFYFFGINGLVYLFASFWFSIGGLHPVAARLIQEHFTPDSSHETFDYYGPLNVIALNAGFHNEHHDFPEMPWRNLPELKKMAPEFYDGLKAYTSWTRLLLEFIFDPQYSLSNRVVRNR